MTTALWSFEILNAVVTALKRHRIDNVGADRFLYLLEQLVIEVVPAIVAHSFVYVRPVALEFGLTAYDASYLELAYRRRLTLATNDARMREAARSLDVPIWSDPVSPE